MQFLNPLYLIGLVAATIPIIIHLLIIRKNKTVEFSTIRFLKELQKSQIRRLKLKQILLLILRTLLIAFIVLAFSRPVIKSNLPFFGNYSNLSAVIILDNSFSMDISDEQGNRFRQAKRFTESFLQNLRDGDQASLIFTTDRDHSTAFFKDFDYLREQIAKSQISLFPSSFEQALHFAQKEIDGASNLGRQIIVVSDFQKSALLPFNDSTKLFDNKTTVELVQIGADSKIDLQNVSVDSVIPITRLYEIGKYIEFEVHLRNNSTKTVNNLVVSLSMNNERVAQRNIDISGKSVESVTIGAVVKNYGAISCCIELESDAIEYDNKRWNGFIVPRPPKVGLVSNKQNSYLKEFLSSFGNDKINFDIIYPENFLNLDLSAYSLLIFESLELSVGGWSNLSRFIASGKGVLIFADPKLSPNELRQNLASINIVASLELKTFPQNNSANITFLDKSHPLFLGVYKPTEGKKTEAFEGPNIRTGYFLNAGATLIQTNGGPLLNEIKMEGGRVIYCAIPPTLEWSNFPLTSLFPVVVYRSLMYLSTLQDLNYSVHCGNSITINIPKSIGSGNVFKLFDPLGNEKQIQSVALPSGNFVTLDKLDMVGVYTIQTADGIPISTIAVNPDTKESRLELSDETAIVNYFQQKFNRGVRVNYFEGFGNTEKASIRTYVGTELWKLFIILAILTAFAEMYVAKTAKKEISET